MASIVTSPDFNVGQLAGFSASGASCFFDWSENQEDKEPYKGDTWCETPIEWAARVCWVSLKFSQFLGYSTDLFSVSSNLLLLMSLHSNSTSHHSNGFGRRHVDVRSIASMNYILPTHGLMNTINFLSNPTNPVASLRR